jgi:hypothetical protein
LYQDDGLAKVHDEIVLGLHLARDGAGRFITQVYIRPLFWPGIPQAYGLTERIGHWCDPKEGLGEGSWYLDGPELAAEVAGVLARVINTHIIPFFAQLTDGPAILRYQRTHFRDPLLCWNPIVVGGSRSEVEILGYVAAWSGDRRKARSILRNSLSMTRREQGEYWESLRAHLQRTLTLLDKPSELRAFLQETADQQRFTLKLDQARPVLEMLERRRRQRREGDVSS